MAEKKETLKFSILVPVYQVEKYIDECIQSVLNQTYANWELILVDDGTKDNSGIICDRYAEKYPHIHVYHKENRGLVHTRRYAIARATGDYYVFLDSDDMLKPHALQTISDAIEKHHCDCLVYGYERFLNGRIIEITPQEKEQCITDKRTIYRKCCFGGCGYLWRKAVRASVFRGEIDYSPYYHISHGEDELQSLEILKNSEKVCFIDDKLYHYRVNPNSITQTANEKQQKSFFVVWELMLKFFRKEEVFGKEDYREFGTACLDGIHYWVVKRAIAPGSIKSRVESLRRIKKERVYRYIFRTGMYHKKKLGLKSRIVLGLLERNCYYTLLLISCLYFKVKAFKNKVLLMRGNKNA